LPVTDPNKASVACVIPTLNSARTLETTLLSLLAQGGRCGNILVADSGSNDGTLEICRKQKVRSIYVEPGNLYRAVNRGIEALLRETECEYLAYLNSDDWLLADSYRRLIERGEPSKADVVYGNCDYCDGVGRFIYPFFSAAPEQLTPLFRMARMGFAQPAAIFKRSLYERLGGFDESFLYKADADFFLRALKSGANFERLEGPSVAGFRLHASQLSNRMAENIEREGERLFHTAEMKAGALDRLTLARWQLANLPNYVIRVLRASSLSGRLRLPRSVEAYSHR
jgi:glycosyltransferase involved in cell wall biosynthesis